MRDRKSVHAPTTIAGNRPITSGYDLSTLSWVPELAGSWAPPLLFERISSAETPHQKGASQLRRISEAVQPQGGRLVSLWDSEYGCASFVNATYDIAADKLFRLRPNRCMWRPPPPYPGRGRPAVHGPAFKLRAPLTWGQPASKLELRRSGSGPGAGARLAPAALPPGSRLAARGGAQRTPGCGAHGCATPACCHGAEPPPLATWWDWYLRRLAVDDWQRFAQQDMHWTLPHLATPEQAERWSAVMPLLTWQLWLARTLGNDVRLPWQQPQTAGRRPPGRVRPGMAGLLAAIGTPAPWPKPRRKAPGGRPGACVSAMSATQCSKSPHKA